MGSAFMPRCPHQGRQGLPKRVHVPKVAWQIYLACSKASPTLPSTVCQAATVGGHTQAGSHQPAIRKKAPSMMQ